MATVRFLSVALALAAGSSGIGQVPVGREGAALRQALGAGQAPVADERAALRQAVERGIRLHAYDRAAWIGSDALAADRNVRADQLGGWIVDGPAEAPELVFHDRNEAEPRAVYIVAFRDGKLVSQRAPDLAGSTLSPARRSLIAAKRVATAALVASKPTRCGDRPFNSVVLPPARAGDPTLDYFLTPQTKPDVLPFGGHYLVPVSDAAVAGPVRRFAKSCLAMPTREPGKPVPTALGVSHSLDAIPTEMHVFASLAARLPVVVVILPNAQTWIVDGTRPIRKLPGQLRR